MVVLVAAGVIAAYGLALWVVVGLCRSAARGDAALEEEAGW